jgi:hypothetical protein
MNRLAVTAALALIAPLSLAVLPKSGTAQALSWSTNGVVALSASTYSVAQSSGAITLTAVRVGGKTGAYSVTYATSGGTAVNGTNYTGESGTLKWANGDSSSKTFTIAINEKNVFSGTKSFKVLLTAGSSTMLGSPTNATINISGGTKASSPPSTPAPPTVVKSIKQWGVACNDTTDETNQLSAALTAAAAGAFELQIDCPVRFHTGSMINHTITIPDGVTVKFAGSGELLTVSGGATALNVPHPTKVTFIEYNLTYL